MNPVCKIHPINDDEFNKLDIPENQRTDIQRRIAETERILASQRTGTSFQRTADISAVSLINRANMERVGNMAGGVSLRETRVNPLKAFLVREFAVVSDLFSGNYTPEGWVRESINRVERLTKGGIDKALRDLGVVEYVNTNFGRLTKELKSRGIGQADRAYIMSESARIGFFPFLQETEMLRSSGRAYLQSELTDFIHVLGQGKYKLPGELIDDIISTGRSTGLLYNKMLFTIQEAGVQADMWDLYPRNLTDAARQRVNWRYGGDNKIIYNNGDISDAEEAFLRSSTTNAFVVEDEVLLDVVIRRVGVEQYDDPLALYKRALPELTNPGIADIIDSKNSMIPIMKEILERGYPDVLESLYDSQLLSKIPLSNAEVFENMQRMMKMPFKELDEVFAQDWRKGLLMTRQHLEFQAKKSGFVNLMVSEAANGNWGVTALERATDPRFKDFVPIRQAIDDRVLRGTMMAKNPSLDSLYVHPFVASMARAHQEITMSPFAMSIFARAIYTLNRTWGRLSLLTLEYVPRQVLQGMISVGISGSNLLNYPTNLYKVATNMLAEASGRSIKAFDDTLPKYRLRNGSMLTEQGLYDYLADIGLASKNDLMLGDGFDIRARTIRPDLNARYIVDVLAQQGPGTAVQEGLAYYEEITRRLGIPNMLTNNIVNNAGLMTVVQSSLRSGKRNPISYTLRNIINPNTFDTVEDAVEYAKQFFYYYDDTTRFNEFMRQYVVPFWGFTSRNLPAMVRYTYNHPSRFMAIQRAYALANEPMQDNEWLNEGTVQDYLLQGKTFYWKVPGGRFDGRDAYYAVDLTTLDPVASAISDVQSWAAIFGFSGRPKATTQTLDEESESNPLIRALIRAGNEVGTMPLYETLLTLVQEYSQPGYERSKADSAELFGISMSRPTKILIETLFPVVRQLERPSVPILGQDRFDAPQIQPMPITPGVRVYALDVYANLGFTWEQLEYTKRDIKRLINQAPNEQERRRYESLYEEMENDQLRIEAFARREGVDVTTAYESLRERRIRIGDLKPNGQLP